MSLFEQVARVRLARSRMRAVRHALTTPAAALLLRGRGHPLATVGAAAGVGFVLGRLGVRPLRVPGLGSLLGGGLTELLAHAVRMVAELAAAAPPAAPAAADTAGSEPA